MTDHQEDFERYIELRQHIATLNAEIDVLKPRLLARVHEIGDRLLFGGFVFRSSVTRSWRFSDDVARLQIRLRDTKRKEIAQGVAEVKKETRFVTMTPAKNPIRDSER